MIISDFNWISLHYPHFGGPTTGPYHGPPILLVLLNFSIFIYLVWRFVWPMLERYAKQRREKFLKEYEHANKLYSLALKRYRESEKRRHEIFIESQSIRNNIITQGEREAVMLLKKGEQYVKMRLFETEKQIQVKRAREFKELHDVIMRQIIKEAREIAIKIATTEDKKRLYLIALEHINDKVGGRRVRG